MFSRVFKAFQYPDFRLLWFGACTSSIGTWMQNLAQSWLVLQISGSPYMLGLNAFLAEIPIFLFSLVGGVVADRMDRRKLLLISQFVQMASAFLLTALIVTKTIKIEHILALSFIVGIAQAFGGPAYSALVPSLVKQEDLPNAIALNSIQFNVARVIGPVIGGLAMENLGAGWCFGINGLSFIAVIISLLRLKINFNPPRTGESLLTGVQQGIAFVRERSMEKLIVIAFLMTALAIPMITFLPVFAKDVFHGNAGTYTWFLASSGIGSITGALIVAAIGNVAGKGRIALLMLIALGALISGVALSKNIVLTCICIFFAGAALMCAFAMISSLVQLITTNEMRGRVMSVYNVAFRGGMPFGSLATGRLMLVYPAPIVLAVNGVLLVCMGFYFLLFQRKVAAL